MRGFILKSSWIVLLTPILSAFIIGAILMPWFEPETSALQSFNSYWWWFYVTITTIGYGDIVPVSLLGRLLAIVTSLISIATFAAILQKSVESGSARWTMRLKGRRKLKMKGHIVIIGYRLDETERIIRELLADRTGLGKLKIVLCSANTKENPFPDKVDFVCGVLDSPDVISRACIAEARMVIIHGSDDAQTVFTALAVYGVNKNAHIIAKLDNPNNKSRIQTICPRIECITPISHLLMAQAAKTPFGTTLLHGLFSDEVDDALLCLELSKEFEGVTFKDVRKIMIDHYDALPLSLAKRCDTGVEMDNHPSSDTIVSAGMLVYYMARKPLAKLAIPKDYIRGN